jgi:hypothetical protein
MGSIEQIKKEMRLRQKIMISKTVNIDDLNIKKGMNLMRIGDFC